MAIIGNLSLYSCALDQSLKDITYFIAKDVIIGHSVDIVVTAAMIFERVFQISFLLYNPFACSVPNRTHNVFAIVIMIFQNSASRARRIVAGEF